MHGASTSAPRDRTDEMGHALRATRVVFAKIRGKSWLMVELDDGRSVGVPLALYPTLQRASAAARARWRRIGDGQGFHWPALDLDLSVRGITLGIPERAPDTRRRSA